MTYYYGATSKQNIVEAIRIACTELSPSTAPRGISLVSETFSAETGFGQVRDGFEKQGRGLGQFDLIGFQDVKNYVYNRNDHVRDVLAKYDIKWLYFEQLDYSPLLSAFVCRIKYMMDPNPIPETIEGRAHYWKRIYNTEAGKGTPEHYMKMYKRHYLGDQ